MQIIYLIGPFLLKTMRTIVHKITPLACFNSGSINLFITISDYDEEKKKLDRIFNVVCTGGIRAKTYDDNEKKKILDQLFNAVFSESKPVQKCDDDDEDKETLPKH